MHSFSVFCSGHLGIHLFPSCGSTVIIEAHSVLKCPAVRAMHLPIPCPSGDQYRLQRC